MALFTIESDFRYEIVRKIFEGGMGVKLKPRKRYKLPSAGSLTVSIPFILTIWG